MNGADPLMPYALFAGASGPDLGRRQLRPADLRRARQGRGASAAGTRRARSGELLEPAMNLIWQGDYVQSVYAAAEITGYGAGQPRRPLRALDPAKLDTLARRPRRPRRPRAGGGAGVTTAPASSRPPSSRTSPGVCGWAALLPPRAGTPPLAEAVTADVTVIGAGFAGLSAARRLAQLDPSLRVVVLEAGIVGNGPAGRNSGFIIDLPHEVSSEDYGGDSLQKSRDHITLQRRAVDFATELAAERSLGRATLDPCGRYSLALSPEGDQHLADYAAQLDRLGEAAHACSTPRRSPTLPAPRPSPPASTCPAPSSCSRPPTSARWPTASAPPVRLFESTPATAFERKGAGWLVSTPQGSVESPRIVLANNGYAERFGFFRGKLLHVYHLRLDDRALRSGPPRRPAVLGRDPGLADGDHPPPRRGQGRRPPARSLALHLQPRPRRRRSHPAPRRRRARREVRAPLPRPSPARRCNTAGAARWR